jgi:hypothetical protein
MLMGLLAVLVFMGSVVLPIALSIASYRRAQNLRHGWIFHLLFVPVAVLCEWAAIALLGLAAGDNGDGPPGEGFLYAPAFLTLIITVITYYVWLVTMTLARVLKRRTFVR